ncbi:MAG: hypothetical protein ACD_76C00109G0010 [uncultured bacterium]|nr:MAG: hypothetical protein ACD_76C00109G0010 [uncultured bacterium]HBD04934.1 hypothetical protein [Candidatus Uhrbacteria bacterium]
MTEQNSNEQLTDIEKAHRDIDEFVNGTTAFSKETMEMIGDALKLLVSTLFAIGTFVRLIAITLAILLVAALISIELFVLSPLEKSMTADDAPELAYIGGIASMWCVYEEYMGLEDEIEELEALAEHGKQKGKNCISSLTSLVSCYVSLQKAAKDPITWANAYEKGKDIYKTWERFNKVRGNALKIAKAIPEYDDTSLAFKKQIVRIFKAIDDANIVSVITSDPDLMMAIENQDIKISLSAWNDYMLDRYPQILIFGLLGGGGAFEIAGAYVSWRFLSKDSVDEAMQGSKTYKYARTEGCLKDKKISDVLFEEYMK